MKDTIWRDASTSLAMLSHVRQGKASKGGRSEIEIGNVEWRDKEMRRELQKARNDLEIKGGK